MGPEVYKLESQLAHYPGSNYCISCSSGTDALLMPLMAQGIGPGNAVFTTPFTFIARKLSNYWVPPCIKPEKMIMTFNRWI